MESAIVTNEGSHWSQFVKKQSRYFWELWATLLLVPGLGTQRIKRIITTLTAANQSLESWWQQPYILSSLPNEWMNQSVITCIKDLEAKQSVTDRIKTWEAADIIIIPETDSRFPPLLLMCPDHPGLLFCKGEPIASHHTLAVVGTRQMTPYGAKATQYLVEACAMAGITIVSGWMTGVDFKVHQVCWKHHRSSWGFLGYGHFHSYPRWLDSNREAFLGNGGVLWSEYPPPTTPRALYFPIRNRLIAGSAPAVLVIEAAEQSGTLITAQWALEYGRQVLAVPGPITSQYCQGTTWLINQGATLITKPQDILAELAFGIPYTAKPNDTPSLKGVSEAAKEVWSLLQAGPADLDHLVEGLHQDRVQVLQLLSELEINCYVTRRGQTWYGV